nr:MAG TPA: hypothetical protein [Caudoviricetes sp.]
MAQCSFGVNVKYIFKSQTFSSKRCAIDRIVLDYTLISNFSIVTFLVCLPFQNTLHLSFATVSHAVVSLY